MAFKGITCATAAEAAGHITAADDAAIFQSIVGSDGVFNIGSEFKATTLSNNKVRVADGVLCVGGHIGRTSYGTYDDLTIENGASGQNRNDIIYAKFITSGSTDSFTLAVKKGTATTETAADPVLTQGVLYNGAAERDIPLWRVKLQGLSIVAVQQMFTVIPNIPELKSEVTQLNTNLVSRQERIVCNIYRAPLTGNWVIVKKPGYLLIAAYSVRDDAAYFVKGIQKRPETDMYTVIIDGVNGGNIDLWLMWAKL